MASSNNKIDLGIETALQEIDEMFDDDYFGISMVTLKCVFETELDILVK